MGALANILLIVAGIAVFIIWIVSLCKWDGKCPCKPEDCENCPYSGTGCETDPKSKTRKDKTP